MDELLSTEGIVALSAGGLALIALLLALVLAIKLRRLRSAQRAVLGGAGERDLITHAARLETGFAQLRDWLEETAAGLEQRVGTVEQGLAGAITYRALVRYDAYGEMSGRQSSSLALLDARKSGVVVSSILHRDQARVYVKQVVEGESELELSPEERDAIGAALGRAVAEA